MKTNQTMEIQLVIIKNPYDNKWYNITPLLTLVNEFGEGFIALSDYMEKAGEILPFMIENEEHSRLDVINCTQIINDLKRTFRHIKQVEN